MSRLINHAYTAKGLCNRQYLYRGFSKFKVLGSDTSVSSSSRNNVDLAMDINNKLNKDNDNNKIYADTTGQGAADVTKLGAKTNLVLAISKGIAGYYVNSTGLMADAMSSLGDLVTDAVVYFSVLEARKGKTAENPWGKGKFEPLGALTVGGLLCFTGFGIGWESYTAFVSIIDINSTSKVALKSPEVINGSTYFVALAVSGLGIIAKEVLFRVSLREGIKANSSVVIANAWQHRSDVGTSSAVFAGLLGSYLGYPLLDPLAGLLVSGVIIKQALSTVIDAFHDLSDAQASKEETSQLKETCINITGIEKVDEIFARKSGPYLYVECTVGVNGNISASAAHRLAELTKQELLMKHNGRVAHVVVHVNPIGNQGLGEQSPEWARDHDIISKKIKKILLKIKNISDISDVQVYYRDDGKIGLKVDVCIEDSDTSVKMAHLIAVKAKQLIIKKLPWIGDVDVDLELEEDYPITPADEKNLVIDIDDDDDDDDEESDYDSSQYKHANKKDKNI